MAGFEEVEDKEFDTFQDRTPDQPSSESEDGDGGDDLEVFHLDREDRLEQLAVDGLNNESSFTLSGGVMDTPQRPLETGFPEGERETDGTPPSTSREGDGGDDLEVFDVDREDRLEQLAAPGLSNESSFTLSGGVMDTHQRPLETGFPEGERESDGTPPITSLDGPGGEERQVFNLDREDRLQQIASPGLSNESSYPTEGGVIDTSQRSFAIGFPEGEKTADNGESRPASDGILLGRNVFDVELFGEVLAVDDRSNPDLEAALLVAGAEITLIPEEAEDITDVTVTSARDGVYAVGLPEFETEYLLAVSHPFLGETAAAIEVERDDAELDIIYEVGAGAAGLSVGRGVSLG